MLKRPEFPHSKNCMVISDYPIKSEVDQDQAYCSASNLTLMGDLHRVGIKQKDCGYTYLSYERPEQESFDFMRDFSKHKNLEPFPEVKLQDLTTNVGAGGQPFYKLEHQKDTYVSEKLMTEFLGLLKQIRIVNPKMIIITGKWSLFFLTGVTTHAKTQGNFKDSKPLGGLSKFRASVLSLFAGFNLPNILVLPLLPPTTRHRMPDKLPIIQWDFNKAGEIYHKLIEEQVSPDYYLKTKRNFVFTLDIDQLIRQLNLIYSEIAFGEVLVSVDIETRHGTIDCIGLTTKVNKGVCIPFSTIDSPIIWDAEDEVKLVTGIKQILLHPNCKIVGQNFSYDAQYLYKFWLIDVHAYLDTMTMHHVMFNYMQKSLDFLASVYCDQYAYWKDMQDHGK